MFASKISSLMTVAAMSVVLLVGCSEASSDSDAVSSVEPVLAAEALPNDRLLALLKHRIPAYDYLSASDTGVAGMKAVIAKAPNGQNVTIYVTADGQHLFTGKMFRIGATGLVDVQDEKEKPKRVALLKQVPQEDMITFSAKDEKTAVWVFTDVNCGYCKRFHAGMDEMNKLGITVRYLAFPVIGQDSMPKMSWAWCQADRKATLQDLKSGAITSFGEATCDNNPVQDQYRLGMQLGVTGTPAIFLADGTRLPGAVAPDVIAEMSGIK